MDQSDATGNGRSAGEDLGELIPALYDDLRRIAHERLRREGRPHTLCTTAIVHEAYMRLAAGSRDSWKRAHFMAVSSRIIRNLLIDYERRRSADKRGGEAIRIPVSEEIQADGGWRTTDVELLDLEAALVDLSRKDPRLEKVVEYRFFGGLTVAETAEALGTSVRTVERDWTRARAYLIRALQPESAGE